MKLFLLVIAKEFDAVTPILGLRKEGSERQSLLHKVTQPVADSDFKMKS